MCFYYIWPLNKLPFPGRIQPVHKVLTLKEAGISDGVGWDDELTFNTQVSLIQMRSSRQTTKLVIYVPGKQSMGQPGTLATPGFQAGLQQCRGYA
jgi:hypothetical protein